MVNVKIFGIVIWTVLCVISSGCEKGVDAKGTSANGTDSGNGYDGDTASDSQGSGSDATGSDDDSDSGTEPEQTGYDHDDDSDGYSEEEGDCHDLEKYIGPDAIEDLGPDGAGDGMDNDCDGQVDEDETCDTDMTGRYGNSAEALACAMNLGDERFLKNAEKIHSWTDTDQDVYLTLRSFSNLVDGVDGCLAAQQGYSMAYLGTGPIGGDPNGHPPIDGVSSPADDPQPAFQGDASVTPSGSTVCDLTQMRLELKAPVNAHGFSFDFLFASAEYPEYLEAGWNDTFYAIMEYKSLNNGATTNIAFDLDGNEIEVDANFFENDVRECEEQYTYWSESQSSGSTGWLRTVWDLAEHGDEFVLTFSIHDEGEGGDVACGWDSMVLLDNFQWITEDVPITPGTAIIIID